LVQENAVRKGEDEEEEQVDREPPPPPPSWILKIKITDIKHNVQGTHIMILTF